MAPCDAEWGEFWDLDPMQFDQAGSVLSSITDYPLAETQHGAIIGTDNRIVDLVRALTREAPLALQAHPALKWGAVAKWVAQADEIYKSHAMCFPERVRAELAAEYEDGVPRVKHSTPS